MTTPYYQDAGVTIYHGNCIEILPTLEPFDAVVTDPPFFMPAVHYQARTNWRRAWADTSILAAFMASVLDAAVPKLKPTGHFLAFCNGDSYPVFYPELYRRFDVLKSLVWNKTQIGMGHGWRNQHELIIAARWESSAFHGWSADVVDCKPVPSAKRDHPVQKPDELLAALVLPVTAAGDVVVDPFMGSASTLSAAVRLGRKAVGIDAEERYCERAARMFSERLPIEVLS